MKERPILLNGDMVRAILDGRKTQTRRLINPQPFNGVSNEEAIKQIGGLPPRLSLHQVINQAWRSGCADIPCPLGKPCDRLWVRETWWQAGDWVSSYPEDDEGHWGGSKRIHFAADGNPPNEPNYDHPDGLQNGSFAAAHPYRVWRKRPSIHMPRWASRITLEITTVRVERIQDISEEDAKSEGLRWHSLYREWGGVELHPDSRPDLPQWRWYDNPVEAFKYLWESINGAGSWDQNPWVWVIEFRRVEQQAEAAA
ncbi:hypothetical protein ACJJIU_00070 [Microbulbifer sp. CnH-101-E]|uniref:hypothetical protein n=1 Tax=unclassified Microbulbifer TaxID=2619833 RepID=UPI00403A37E6